MKSPRIFIYAGFIAITTLAYISHHPMGVFESMVWDEGHKAGVLYASIDPDVYASDPFLSEVPTKFATELSFHRFFLQYFETFENYFAFLNVLLLLMTLVLVYEVFLILTENKPLSLFGSLLLSFSTLYFSTGDCFASYVVLGTSSKTISFLIYLAGLALLLKYHHKKWCVYLISLFFSLTIWNHPLTFIGAGAVTILCSYLIYFRGYKKKIFISSIIVLVVIAGYFPLFFQSFGFKNISNNKTLTETEVNIIKEKHIEEFQYVYSPSSVLTTTIQTDFGYIKNYKKLVLIVICLIPFWPFLHKNTKFFILCGALIVLSTFCIRYIDYIIFEKNILKFAQLNRNLKWLYIFCLFAVLSTYPLILERVKGMKSLFKVKLGNTSVFWVTPFYCLLIFFILSGPIKKTYIECYSKDKVKDKIQNMVEAVKIDAPIKTRPYSIVQVNSDIYDLLKFIDKEIDADATFLGPAWIRVMTRHPVIYTEYDGFYYMWAKDTRYFKWREHRAIVDNLSLMDKENLIESLDKMGVEFYLIRKFDVERGRVFKQKDIDLSDWPVAYQNRSYAVIKITS